MVELFLLLCFSGVTGIANTRGNPEMVELLVLLFDPS